MFFRLAVIFALSTLILPVESSAQSVFQLNPTIYVGIGGGYVGGYASQHDAGVPVAVSPVAAGGGGGGAGAPEGGAGGGGGGAVGVLAVGGSGSVTTNSNAGGSNLLPVAVGDGTSGLKGVSGAGIIGSSVSYGALIFGIEGDFGASTASGYSSACGTLQPHVCGTRIDAISDVRGRFGYVIGPFTPFISGGLAVDHLSAYDALIGSSGSAWKAGYTVGGGIDYKLSKLISLRLEYLHTDLGTTSLFNIVPGVPERVYVRSEMVRAAVVFDLYSPQPR